MDVRMWLYYDQHVAGKKLLKQVLLQITFWGVKKAFNLYMANFEQTFGYA